MNKLIAAGLAALSLAATPAIAQSDYPNRPVKLVVGFGAGGSTDIVARIVARHLSDKLGQPVVVLRNGGKKAVAFGVHFATAIVVLVSSVLLFAVS